MCPDSELLCNTFILSLLILLRHTVKLLMVCQLPHMYSSDMTLYVNHSSLLMTDLTKCSNAQTNISHSPLKVVMILSQLIASSLHTLITIFHMSHHQLQLPPLHLLEQPDPVDMFISQSTSHHSCRNTLGEE